MNWAKFNTHGESANRSFEVMCNLAFEAWCKKEYGSQLEQIVFVNGEGGDGGVEAFAVHRVLGIIGVQSKWFREKIENTQIAQIRNSFLTAVKVRPALSRYIVCVPRDLGSKKMVKGEQIAKNTEEDRWNNLKDELCQTHPNVKIDLWDDTRIQEIITWPELQGVHKYWFENTVLFDSQFTVSFEKAKNSWAKAKYIPDLYAEGVVHQEFDLFLGSFKLTETRAKKMSGMMSRLEKLQCAYTNLLAIGFPDSECELERQIQDDIKVLDYWLSFLGDSFDGVKRGDTITFKKEFSLSCGIEDLDKSSFRYNKFFHYKDAEEALEGLIDEFYVFDELVRKRNENKMVILGDPGSGKTTGIVTEIANCFTKKTHLPILVHARDYSGNDTWSSIIEKTLGITANWEEQELFLALQSAALISAKRESDEYNIDPCCVICVDGIDESSHWEFWKRKIEEVAAYREKYPRIRFVFLSRPYVFPDWYRLDYRSCFVLLPASGDVHVEKLFDAYFQKYDITIGNNKWIKRVLKTPLALHLFCDVYQGESIKNINSSVYVITSLFQKKIETLDNHYNEKHNYSAKNYVKNILYSIASLFVHKRKVTYEELCDTVSVQYHGSLLDVLQYLENEGFIYSFLRQENEFSVGTTYYSWGMQPALDYLVARKVLEAILNDEKIDTEYSQGVYQMLSLITVEEKGKLLFEYSNIDLNDDIKIDILCYALANASIDAAVRYKDYLMKLMEHSVEQFRTLVRRIIIPVSSVAGHPLGTTLLDAFLRKFDNSAERDVWWSIPAFLRLNHDASWASFTEIPFDEVTLEDEESAFTHPLFWAWSLSNVSNEIRQNSRMKLFKWGLKNQSEFLTLLFYVSNVDDYQILEDLFSIAYGISLSPEVTEEYLKTITKWILENVFSAIGLNRYENIMIRYYCSGVVCVAILWGLEAESVRADVMPPYNYVIPLKEIAVMAANAERMGGYKSITYDLARYVLCDHLDGFFRNMNPQVENAKAFSSFIQKYRQQYDLKELKADGLIISMAYQFLQNTGWNESLFLRDSNTGYEGVDSAILRTYYPATHGNRSPIMSVAEKEIWLARHCIECVLANEVAYMEIGSRSAALITDYSQLEDFNNLFQDYVNELYQDRKAQWFHMNLLASCHQDKIDKTVIEEWMNEDKAPDFRTWLTDYKDATMIYASTTSVNEQAGIEETLWVSAGIVKRQDFSSFLECMDECSEEKYEFTNVAYFHSSQSCRCYCTPQEVCRVFPEKEIDSSIYLCDETIEIGKAVQECLYLDAINGEKTFMLPSRLIRDLLSITYGDGYKYYDESGKVVAEYDCNGEDWKTQQKILLIDSDILVKRLNEEGYKLFWLFRVYRSPSSKAYEKYYDIMHDTDVSYLVWIDDDVNYKVLQRTQSER